MLEQHIHKQRVCKFFQQGRCTYGARCRFSHELSADESHAHNEIRPHGRHAPESPLYGRLRTWKFNIARKVQLVQPITPLGGAKLQAFLSTALLLVTSCETDIVQQTIEFLASEGGLARIKEAITAVADSLSDRQCLQNGENMLLPLLEVLTHPDVTQSFMLEQSLAVIHNFIYGIGGSRTVLLFSAATRFLSLLEAPSTEKSKAVAAVLTCLHNIIELNSSAKVVPGIYAVVKDLGDVLEVDLAESHDVRRLFQRTQDRLNEGSALPKANLPHTTSAVLPHFAALTLESDQPGQLSPKGIRHDNDHDDISLISILPTASEVQSERAEYIPVKDPRSLHLGGVEGLLDRHFRLLREDTIGQLRDTVRAETESLRDPSAPFSDKLQHNVRRFAYRDVKLTDITFNRVGGLRAHLSFPQPKALANKSEQVRRQWWEHSKRLTPDALLCLVDASESVAFFTVCGNEGDRSRPDSHCSKLLYQDPSKAGVIVRLVEPYELDIERLVMSLSRLASSAHVLCEFPGILLPSFYPTLKALQRMSTTLDLPFADVLAPSDTHLRTKALEPPRYAVRPGFKFDLKSIAANEHLELCLDAGFDYAALAASSSLDEAQQTAVISALTRKLALIQGPPGTGKSFTGVALIKVLLDNAPKAELGPIVCVCYTNHALDQLLEHLVGDGVEEIIRVGSRSKSELIRRFNLHDAVQSAERTPMEKRRYAIGKSAIETEAEEMQPLLATLMTPTRPNRIRKFLQRQFPTRYLQLYKGEMDGDGFQTVDNDPRQPLIKWLHPKGMHRKQLETESPVKVRSLDHLQHVDVWSMTLQERSALHNHWIETLKNDTLGQLSSILSTVGEHVQELKQCRKEDELRVLTRAKVIGVTTSGLARNLDVLRRLNSKVLICEEAGEVLEAHLLTALLPSVEHAILIGDHQQLKPQIANYELSSENPRGLQYSLDVSLFERLLHPDVSGAVAIPYSTLRTQRRMHPSIAGLIRDTLYPGLIDHPSVHDYPEVDGLKNRLFWFDHDHPESGAERRESTSHTNTFEVEMVAALVHHLVRQSRYSSEDVAVLTPYLGQLVKLRNKLGSSFEIVVGDRDEEGLEKEGLKPDVENTIQKSVVKKTSLSKAVRIATVDNFQGEEAKVVIISLVRSNQEKRCGFLKTTNRINVLLSRAQHGMYILGDSNTYKHVEMWQQVIQRLEDSDALGRSLALCCPRHPQTDIKVASPDDFAIKAPEGGCDLMCDWRLKCGHKCINKCHTHILHQEVFCREACPRSLPGCDHGCALPCGATCGLCKVKLHDIALPCGHIEASLDCYLAQNPTRATCRKTVLVKVPACGHVVKKQCCEPDPGPNYLCTALCGELLPCGHGCASQCYTCKPRKDGEILRTEHGACKTICKRSYNTCSHYCREACHDGSACGLCSYPCEVRCAHSRCAKPCSEPCAPCAEVCTWSCPHTGKCDLPCAVPCNKLPCPKRCETILDCGHQCPSVCGETCPSADFCQVCCSGETRDIMVDYVLSSTYGETNLDEDPCLVPDCGHLMTMASMDGYFGLTSYYEMNSDGEVLAVKGSSAPFSTEGFKACPICRGPLRNINRYSRIVRRSAIDEATKKFISWSNGEIVKHADMLQRLQEQFAANQDAIQLQEGQEPRRTAVIELGRQSDTMKLEGHRNKVMADISRVEGLKSRYKVPFRARNRLSTFLHNVKEKEQPFGRLWELVQDRRRRDHLGVINSDLVYMPSVLQSRAYLMSMSLSIKFDLTVIADALAIRKKMNGVSARYDWGAIDLEVDLSAFRGECLDLAELLASHQQHRLEIETRLSFAHLAALERSISTGSLQIERSTCLRESGLEQVKIATAIHEQFPGQTTGVMEELEAVEKMLNDGTFYNVVTSEEKRAVYEAMRQQFRGTGHWYNCENGHPFTVGECGMPMEQARCPQCGSPIGGRDHEPAEGVRSIDEAEAAMGHMDLDGGEGV